MSSLSTTTGDKPKNTRRPSVRFAEPAQTIFSVQDQDLQEESDLGARDESAAVAAAGGAGDGETAGGGHHPLYAAHGHDDTLAAKAPLRPYGLKSTLSSREAEFEADDSDVDDETDPVLPPVAEGGDDMQRTRPRALSLSLIDRIPGLPLVDRARQSMSDGHNLRESIRSAIDSEELPDWLRRGAGVLDSTWNMSNSILGAGVVGLPYSLKASGCLTGLGLLVGIALLTDWTIRLIVLNAKLSGRTTYIDIMDHCFGRNGRLAVSIFQGAFAFGGMCAFIVSGVRCSTTQQ